MTVKGSTMVVPSCCSHSEMRAETKTLAVSNLTSCRVSAGGDEENRCRANMLTTYNTRRGGSKAEPVAHVKETTNEEQPLSTELDYSASVWNILEPFGVSRSLASIEKLADTSTIHVGLWSDTVVDCGMPLPTGASFIDEFVARNYSPNQLRAVRDRYLKELRSRLPEWLKLMDTDEGWKSIGVKNENVLHRLERKGEAPYVRGRYNMGKELNLDDYSEINMDRDFYRNLYGPRVLREFKPVVTWAGSLSSPWFLNISWLCYHGFSPIVSDREVLTASLVIFLDQNTRVTVSMSVTDFEIDFPEKPRNAVPLTVNAIFRSRQLSDGSVENTGVVQAAMKLLVPQYLFVRSSLFWQPVDWPALQAYTRSDECKKAIGRHPVCALLRKVKLQGDGRTKWLQSADNETAKHEFYPLDDLKEISCAHLCQHVWRTQDHVLSLSG